MGILLYLEMQHCELLQNWTIVNHLSKCNAVGDTDATQYQCNSCLYHLDGTENLCTYDQNNKRLIGFLKPVHVLRGRFGSF